jgi:SAM-dependent methyltransferase
MQSSSNISYARERKSERKQFSESIGYSICVKEAKKRKWMNYQGKALDISEIGMGMKTDIPLTPGNMLWFNSGIRDKAGYVKYCIEMGDEYRIGIELNGKDVQTLDEATDLFLERLQKIEDQCRDSDVDAGKLLQATGEAIDHMLSCCEKFEKETRDLDIIKDARIRFRIKTDYLLSKSYCINRARTWPQGQQGDYKTLEVAYKNTPLSEGIGYYLDHYLLNSSLGTAVRGRLEKLEGILRDELRKRKKPSVLNIACGSCREVFALSSDIEASGARFTCIDIDNDALNFGAKRLSYTNISPLTSNQILLRKYNALRMFDHELNMSEFGKQDIIYSVGFFDYLDSEFLVQLFGNLYELLNPGGMLITSFKDVRRYREQDYHWIVDWDGFLQRDEEDFWKIFSNAKIPKEAITEKREDSGVIVFYLVSA